MTFIYLCNQGLHAVGGVILCTCDYNINAQTRLTLLSTPPFQWDKSMKNCFLKSLTFVLYTPVIKQPLLSLFKFSQQQWTLGHYVTWCTLMTLNGIRNISACRLFRQNARHYAPVHPYKYLPFVIKPWIFISPYVSFLMAALLSITHKLLPDKQII